MEVDPSSSPVGPGPAGGGGGRRRRRGVKTQPAGSNCSWVGHCGEVSVGVSVRRGLQGGAHIHDSGPAATPTHHNNNRRRAACFSLVRRK